MNEIKLKLKKANVNKAISLAMDGLCTDGEHHKQWYLEQILKALGVNLKELNTKMQEDDYAWESGIAP